MLTTAPLGEQCAKSWPIKCAADKLIERVNTCHAANITEQQCVYQTGSATVSFIGAESQPKQSHLC